MRVAIVLALFARIAVAEPAATRAFLREIAAGQQRPADLLDPARGLVMIVYTTGETEPPVVQQGRHVCGAAAERVLARMIRDHLKRAVALDEALSCRNRPGPPTCSAGVMGEGMTTADYVFRRRGERLVIDTIIVTNSVYKPDDERPVIARSRARYATASCDD